MNLKNRIYFIEEVLHRYKYMRLRQKIKIVIIALIKGDVTVEYKKGGMIIK